MSEVLNWKNCTEEALRDKIAAWSATLDLSNSIVFLSGEMGAGKSTFARALLERLAPGQISKGSPTFPLVQEYRSGAGRPIYHIDLYRLKSESELEESGILSQIEEVRALALVEWANQFPESFTYWTAPSSRARAKNVWKISIQPTIDSSKRDVVLESDD